MKRKKARTPGKYQMASLPHFKFLVVVVFITVFMVVVTVIVRFIGIQVNVGGR